MDIYEENTEYYVKTHCKHKCIKNITAFKNKLVVEGQIREHQLHIGNDIGSTEIMIDSVGSVSKKNSIPLPTWN